MMLDMAFDLGIRHFDVAPMYGLGRAEAELGQLLSRHPGELSVTTKFGIYPSTLGASLGRTQAPIRFFLRRARTAQDKAKALGASPSSGLLGRALYRARPWDPALARKSLHQSLRALRVDHVEYFALHDPTFGGATSALPVIEFLDGQLDAGSIRCWGIAGHVIDESTLALARSAGRLGMLQFAADILSPGAVGASLPAVETITFGALARALPSIEAHLSRSAAILQYWEGTLGPGLLEHGRLSVLLLSEALRRNKDGTVLFSTTRVAHLKAAASLAESLDLPEAERLAPALSALASDASSVVPHGVGR